MYQRFRIQNNCEIIHLTSVSGRKYRVPYFLVYFLSATFLIYTSSIQRDYDHHIIVVHLLLWLISPILARNGLPQTRHRRSVLRMELPNRFSSFVSLWPASSVCFTLDCTLLHCSMPGWSVHGYTLPYNN